MRLIRVPDWFERPQDRYPDAPSALRQTFATVAVAESFALSLGLDNVSYGNRLDIGNFANEFLSQLQERNLQMPLAVAVHSQYFRSRFADRVEEIAAMGEAGVILLNPISGFWDDVVRFTQVVYEQGVWSTPSPLHVFFHEYAHLFQTERTRGWQLSPARKTLVAAVSRRALANVDEFVSEVYAGLIAGVEYDEEIIRYYRRVGGRRP